MASNIWSMSYVPVIGAPYVSRSSTRAAISSVITHASASPAMRSQRSTLFGRTASFIGGSELEVHELLRHRAAEDREIDEQSAGDGGGHSRQQRMTQELQL